MRDAVRLCSFSTLFFAVDLFGGLRRPLLGLLVLPAHRFDFAFYPSHLTWSLLTISRPLPWSRFYRVSMSCSVDELLKIDGPSEIAMRTLHGDEPRVIEGFVAKAECPFLGETKFTLAQLRMKLVRLTSYFRFVKAADELRKS
jgi:hypothetical protein